MVLITIYGIFLFILGIVNLFMDYSSSIYKITITIILMITGIVFLLIRDNIKYNSKRIDKLYSKVNDITKKL